jgi:deaminated glutathione amidase
MSRETWLAAVVQMCSGENVEENVEVAIAQVEKAASRGARLVLLPENFVFLRINKETPTPTVGLDHPIVRRMQDLCRKRGIDLILGSIPVPGEAAGKFHNTSVYIGKSGEILGAYKKMHLFDIDIPGRVTLKESDFMSPGTEPCLVDAELGKVGLTICYDLRFPELYRRLTVDGARVLTCPAAFTLHTGKDHWIPLLRARAIENQVYVLAAGQWGVPGGKRSSYGKSIIIDPWGIPLAIAADGVGIAMAEIDFDHQDRVREGLPCGAHRHAAFWPNA